MSESVGTLVYVKPEPLISVEFEEAVKIANRNSVEVLETMKAQKEVDLSRLERNSWRSFVLFLVSSVILLPSLVLTLRDGSAPAMSLSLVGSIGFISAVFLGMADERTSYEIRMDLSSLALALQLKTRTEEIIAALPKR